MRIKTYPTIYSKTLPLMMTLLLSTLVCSSLSAKPDSSFGGRKGGWGGRIERKLLKHLTPPRFIIRHREQLKLTDQQETQIKALLKAAKPTFAKIRPKIKSASNALIESLKDSSVPADLTLQRADALMALEAQLKRMRLKVALEVRALLTPEQRDAASKLMREKREKRRKNRKKRARKRQED